MLHPPLQDNQTPSTQAPAAPTGSDEQRLQILLEEWILLRDRGQEVSVAELCRDCPHLGETLVKEIALYRRFEPPAPVATDYPEPPVQAFAGLRYQPVRYHAQGGLGVVFVARDMEVGRDVALKRIQERRQHLLQDRERFPREAEITGRLEHPGIVPVYSVGQDTSGQPYYTMRLVAGRTLAEALEAFHQGPGSPGERHRGLRALLNRFIAVCQTIGYAHSRGVIHRDLKPSNVLLGDYGETLVIDWGLARQLNAPEAERGPDQDRCSTEAKSRTQIGNVLGTMGFMSPEQARGDWPSVGPVSDVFSLGATLYAILTGGAPYGNDLANVRAGKFARPRQMSRAVPPALEAICLKAMAASPEQRYPGALDLAADVQRWLDDEPVQAYREPSLQRLGRWGRRHRPLVAAGVMLLMAGLVGLALGLWAVGREQARTGEALKEAEDNLKLARQAIDECFNVAKTHPLFQEPRMELARKLLLEKTLPFYRRFRAQRPNSPALQREEAEQWFRVAFIEQTLGRPGEALHAYGEARDLFVKLMGAHPEAADHQNALALMHSNRGVLLAGQGKGEEALLEYQQAQALQSKLVQAHPEVPVYWDDLARTHNNRANLLAGLGKREEALREYGQALDLLGKLVLAVPQVADYQDALAFTHSNRAVLLDGLGRGEEALQEFQHAQDLQSKLVQAHPKVAAYQNVLARTHNNRAATLERLGKRKEALQDNHQARNLLDKLVQAHPDLPEYQNTLAFTLNNRGVLLARLGQREEALRAYGLARDLLRKLMQADPDVLEYRYALANTHNNRASLLEGLEKGGEALQECQQAYDLQSKLLQAHPEVPMYRESLARICLNRGLLLSQVARQRDSLADFDRGIALLDELRGLDGHSPHVPAHLILGLRRRAEVLARQGRPRDADADWDRALALAPVSQRPELRLQRALSRAHAGNYLAAVAEADDLARTAPLDGATCYDLACVHAVSASAAARDASQPLPERVKTAENHARQAIALLGRAHRGGYFRDPDNITHLDRDDDLAFLRQRHDYRAFVKTLPSKK